MQQTLDILSINARTQLLIQPC